MSFKKSFKKLWHFLWEQDSLASWIANVVIAFVVIKFLVYPGLGLILGTPAPIVAVVSGSMEHDDRFVDWWNAPSCCDKACSSQIIQKELYDKLQISDVIFRGFPFVNGFNKGDIMILYSPKNVKFGDVIVYGVSHRPDPIIHRVVNIENDDTYTTKGDHNCGIAQFETKVPRDRVIGKAVWRVPWLGWVKIAFVGLINLF